MSDLRNLVITLGSTSISAEIRKEAESEALAVLTSLDPILEAIGGDAYLCALDEITPEAAMNSIQKAVREVRTTLAGDRS